MFDSEFHFFPLSQIGLKNRFFPLSQIGLKTGFPLSQIGLKTGELEGHRLSISLGHCVRTFYFSNIAKFLTPSLSFYLAVWTLFKLNESYLFTVERGGGETFLYIFKFFLTLK